MEVTKIVRVWWILWVVKWIIYLQYSGACHWGINIRIQKYGMTLWRRKKEISKMELYLSLGGRHIQINSMLHSLPIYVMPFFLFTLKSGEEIGQTEKGFSLAWCKEIKGYNMFKW